MKRTIVWLVLSGAALGQTAPGDKTDDQASKTAQPRTDRGSNKRRKPADATTIPPATVKQKTSPMDPTMPNDPKTPTSPTAPRTPVRPTDPTRPEDPTKPTNPPPVI